MAKSRDDALSRKIEKDLSKRRGDLTEALSAPEVANYTGSIQKLLEEGTTERYRKLTGDKTARTYRKVNTADNIWDFLIPLHQGNRLPKQILGAGAFGAVFEGRVAYNAYNCREFYAQEEAHEFLKTGNLQEKLEEILGEMPDEITGDHRDTVFKAVHDEALEEAEAMSDREIVAIMKKRYRKIAPKGKICIKLAWLPAGLRRLYKREQLIAGLDHKNIAYVFAVDEVTQPNADDDAAKIIMTAQEFIDDVQTSAEIAEAGLSQRIDYAVQIGEGLRELHRIGLMHRDFKRSNVMITKKGVAKIIDTGLMKSLDRQESSVTGAGAAIGTPAYMPPEQAIGDIVDLRADIYAVGATLYEALVGETPNTLVTSDPQGIAAVLMSNMLPLMPSQTKTVQALVERYITEQELPKKEAKRILQDIDLVMAKLLHRDKEKRYQTVPSYLADLTALRNGERPPVVSEELRMTGKTAEQLITESFAYHLPEDICSKVYLYADADKSQRLQANLSRVHPVKKYVMNPVLRVLKPIGAAAALVGTAAVAGGTALAIAHPELAKQIVDYIAGK
ncbi:serine/threonine protein kinase [Candidatus Woesearchaeota archaeon]|nr:serine/threonine protein kinase [Candidatus Woesearchaeota archaeon]